MHTKTKITGIAVSVVLLLALVVWWSVGRNTRSSAPLHEAAVPGDPPRSTRALSVVEELRKTLPVLNSEQATQRILALLDSGRDESTGLGFKLQPDGFLADSPTLRVFLLDYLARVDRRAAGEYAKRILKEMRSPDEWAISLRNYALAFPTKEGKGFLESKMRELLTHAPWQTDPSAGYLEAFDVAVYVGGNSLVPELSQLLRRQDNSAVTHAAYLSLDRLTIQQPAELLQALLDRPDSMEGREATRANLFARASAHDPQQREILERYLLDPQRSAAEASAFAGVFPNANFMLSNNLLTRSTPPSRAVQEQEDHEALRMIEHWLSQPRFEARRPLLEKLQRRMSEALRPR